MKFFVEMGGTTEVIAASQSDRFRIIARHGGGENRHRIVVRKDSLIRNPYDMAGRKLAVKKGTSTYGGFLAWRVRHAIDIKKVHVESGSSRTPSLPDETENGQQPDLSGQVKVRTTKTTDLLSTITLIFAFSASARLNL